MMFLVPRVGACNLLGQRFSTIFGTRNWFYGKQFFHELGSERECFRMIRAYYIYCALYFYYVGSTSDHQALDPRGGGLGTYHLMLLQHECVWESPAEHVNEDLIQWA